MREISGHGTDTLEADLSFLMDFADKNHERDLAAKPYRSSMAPFSRIGQAKQLSVM